VVVSVLIQLGLHHLPWTQSLFQLAPLSLHDGVLVLALGLVPVTALEVTKLGRRCLGRAAQPALSRR
jgi:P-type Ca2+ transporter type 2C